jgi:hypothetical protein
MYSNIYTKEVKKETFDCFAFSNNSNTNNILNNKEELVTMKNNSIKGDF